jgi:hypothetical protein
VRSRWARLPPHAGGYCESWWPTWFLRILGLPLSSTAIGTSTARSDAPCTRESTIRISLQACGRPAESAPPAAAPRRRRARLLDVSGALDELVELATIEPHAAALRAVIDLNSLPIRHYQSVLSIGHFISSLLRIAAPAADEGCSDCCQVWRRRVRRAYRRQQVGRGGHRSSTRPTSQCPVDMPEGPGPAGFGRP